MFSLDQLPQTVTKKSKRVGRGGNRGKNSGAGNKGQLKRAGKTRLGFEGGQKSLVRRTPKVRGYGNGYGFGGTRRSQTTVLTLSALDRHFEDGDVISLDLLKNKGLIDEKIKKVRIIQTGKLSKRISLEKSDNLYATKGALQVLS